MVVLFRKLCLLVLTDYVYSSTHLNGRLWGIDEDSEIKRPLALVKEDCYDELLVQFNVHNVACLKVALIKGLDLAIGVSTIFVPLPQIIKIIESKSVDGISFTSTALTTYTLIVGTSYSFVNEYAYSSYVDTFFLLIGSSTVTTLLLQYGGSTLKALAFIVVDVSTLLGLSFVAPLSFVTFLQLFNIPINFTGKMIQVLANYQNGSTGQVSIVTWSIALAITSARILTTLLDSGDILQIINFCGLSLGNIILVAQIIYYWDVQQTKND